MPSTYTHVNDYGLVLRTIPGVLDPVPFVVVEITEGSNVVEVASVDGLWPWMAVHLRGIPEGAYIQAIDGLNLILYASVWDDTNGRWSTSAANAQATEDVSGSTGYAQGYNPVPIAARIAMGGWMNEISSSMAVPILILDGGLGKAGTLNTAPFVLEPVLTSSGGTALTQGTPVIHRADSLLENPRRRDEGEPWGFYVLVCEAGHVARVPATPEHSLGPISYTAPAA